MKMDWFVCEESRDDRRHCDFSGCKSEKRIQVGHVSVHLSSETTLQTCCCNSKVLEKNGCSVGTSQSSMLCCLSLKLLKIGTWWKTMNIKYLEVGMVDGKRRAEETLDNGHHRLRHILLHGRVGVVAICSSVANLKQF